MRPHLVWGMSAPCLTCGAKPQNRCRTTTTGRVTDMHAARWEQEALAVAWERFTASAADDAGTP